MSQQMACPACGGKGFKLVTKKFSPDGKKSYDVVVQETCSNCGGKQTVTGGSR